MKTIAQFRITKDENTYVAEGIDLAIVTQATDLDTLVRNIKEAVQLHFEDEDVKDFDYQRSPSILINYEIPQYA